MMGPIKKADSIHKRLVLSRLHVCFHLFVIFLSLGFDNFPLPILPYRLHFLCIFKFETVLVAVFVVKLKDSFALSVFLDGCLLLMEIVCFVGVNELEVTVIELNIGVNPIREKSLFPNLTSLDLRCLLVKKGVNNVIENDFETERLKILEVSILHELFGRKEVFIGYVSSGDVKDKIQLPGDFGRKQGPLGLIESKRFLKVPLDVSHFQYILKVFLT